MSKEEKRGVHMIHEDSQLGEVQIADEVVATIAGLAATEVEGVASMAGNITNELIGKLGVKNLSKGVKVLVTDRSVDVEYHRAFRSAPGIPFSTESANWYFPILMKSMA